MTQDDRDSAVILLRAAADDWLAGIRHIQGALLGVDEMLAHEVGPFQLACEAWYRTSAKVKRELTIPHWVCVALEAAALLEEGWTP